MMRIIIIVIMLIITLKMDEFVEIVQRVDTRWYERSGIGGKEASAITGIMEYGMNINGTSIVVGLIIVRKAMEISNVAVVDIVEFSRVLRRESNGIDVMDCTEYEITRVISVIRTTVVLAIAQLN